MSTYIFDFDGTIADSFHIACDILIKQAKFLGCRQLSSNNINKLRSMHAREILKYLEIPFWKTPWFLKKLRKLGGEKVEEVALFSGWPETLKTLKDNQHILGIITSNSHTNVSFLLKKYSLDKLFDFVVCEKRLFSKAHALKKLIKRLSLDTEDTFYVGDEVRDIEAAKANKIHAIAVSWGFNSANRLKLANPELIITHPAELTSNLLLREQR